MEVAVLAGLVGIGYLYNSNNKDKNPINKRIDKEVSKPNGENVYHSEFYNEADKVIQTLATKNFESSHEEGTKVINNQKLDRIGSDLYSKPLDQEKEIHELKENFSDYIYSNATGSYISKDDFEKNDQGYGMKPYFSKAPVIEGLGDTRRLNAHQGGNQNEFYKTKKETANFFPLEKQEVFGNTFGEGMGDQTRYDSGNMKTNQLPFTQERVSHIDTKGELNREIGKIIADKANIDNLRTENNPKLSYKGKLISGKNINETRGKMGEFEHRNPDKFYESDQSKWFTTTGAYLEKSQRPQEIIPATNRASLNNQPIGNVAPSGSEESEKRPMFRKPMKVQLGNDNIRNAAIENPLVSTELHQKGYRALPNERDTTTLRNYQSNLKTENVKHVLGIQDDIRKTKKQTTITPKYNGNLQNTTINSIVGIQDDIRKTKKQTTIHSKNNGNIHGGYNELTLGYEKPENTTKDTTLFDYMGGAGASVKSDMDKINYLENAETNPTKEIISKGRSPTLSNVKLANGKDRVNMEINKLDYDYTNHRLNSLDRLYGPTKDMDNQGDVTTMKETLDDNSIANRINPELLNPFRNNPLTQSLESFAY